jgi:vacuolar-type H+-ATPase subunit H
VNGQAEGVVDAQLQNLLRVVERNRDERCEALLHEARAQARQLLQQAHREARERLHSKVLAIREEARQQLASATAQRQTHLRLQRHRADAALLTRAWAPLEERLLQRWQRQDSRTLWIDKLVVQARSMLLDCHWEIGHPADWPAQERESLGERLERELGVAPVFVTQQRIVAGLRICAGPTTCIDATRDGLLRARTRIEAMMLATLNECRRRLADEKRRIGN